MKIFTNSVVVLAASILVFAGSEAQSSNDQSTLKDTVNSRVIASTDVITVIIEPYHIETKAGKKLSPSIASIRNDAIRDTLAGLGELRPYTTNYKRLQSAIRRYWKRNIRHPTTNGLARTIMRYVKKQDRDLVRSEVYDSAAEGVNSVKKALRKRKKS